MNHKSITLKQFVEAYIKAHYFRPDGEDRDFDACYGNYRELLKSLEHSLCRVKGFSFNYFRGLSEFPHLDLKVTVTTDLENSPLQRDYIRTILDLSGGECPPVFEFPLSTDTVTCIITERY